MLIINNLNYYFKKSFHAIKNLNLSLSESSLVGLLGHNGSGKTTLLKILGASFKCQSGEIKILGQNALDNSGLIKSDLRRKLGILFQNTSSDPVLSAHDNLKYFARLMNISHSEHNNLIKETLCLANLSDRAHVKVKDLSHGMRRRLEIYRAFMHKPKILLLDEPTEGLDYEETKKFWTFIKEYINREKALVILATHRGPELDHCDQIIMMREGTIIAQSSPKELLAKLDYINLEVTLKNSNILLDNFIKSSFCPDLFYKKVAPENLFEILKSPELANPAISSIRWARPELQDVYESYVN